MTTIGLWFANRENVLKHLKNIYKDKELDEVATAKEFLAVRSEGNHRVQNQLK